MNLFRIPIRGWTKCVHDAAAFESRGEYAVAHLIDDAATVVWWVRNDPAIFRIPTPIGYFEPDFLYLVERGGPPTYGILEVKADVFWDGLGFDARVKADAAAGVGTNGKPGHGDCTVGIRERARPGRHRRSVDRSVAHRRAPPVSRRDRDARTADIAYGRDRRVFAQAVGGTPRSPPQHRSVRSDRSRAPRARAALTPRVDADSSPRVLLAQP